MAGLNERLEEQTAQTHRQVLHVEAVLDSLHDDFAAACVVHEQVKNRLAQAPAESRKLLRAELKKILAELAALTERRFARSEERQRLLKKLGGLQMALVAS